jgi:hypothetical protein
VGSVDGVPDAAELRALDETRRLLYVVLFVFSDHAELFGTVANALSHHELVRARVGGVLPVGEVLPLLEGVAEAGRVDFATRGLLLRVVAALGGEMPDQAEQHPEQPV